MKSNSDKEADAYRNPTELFTLISNGGPTGTIIHHALRFPQEVQTWIVSRKYSKLGGNEEGDGNNDTVWRYLPIHLICLQKNPCKELLLVMRDVFPKSLKMKDYHGNLPIHYLLLEGCEDVDMLDIALDDKYKCLNKRDGEGRSTLEIIDQSNASADCKIIMKRWFQKRDGQCTIFSPHKSASGNTRVSQQQGRENDSKPIEDELFKAKSEIKNLLGTIEKLEWDCEAKDQSLDFMAAQLTSAEHKYKRGQEESIRVREQKLRPDVTQECKASIMATSVQEEDIEWLKAKMNIDATILASQQEHIARLEKELEQSTKDKDCSVSKDVIMEEQIDLLEVRLRQHDEAVSHIRKVNTILQEELNGKEDDSVKVQKQLDILQKENQKFKKEMECKEREAEKRLESFQSNVRDQSETLSNLLQSLRDKEQENGIRVRNDISILQDQLATKDIELLSLENQLYAALTKIAEITNQLAEKERQIDMGQKKFSMNMQEQSHPLSNLSGPLSRDSCDRKDTVQIMQSSLTLERPSGGSGAGISEECSSLQSVVDKCGEPNDASLSTGEIREKQSQLQTELRDIYAQIKAAMPGKKDNKSPPLTAPDHSLSEENNTYDLREAFVRRHQREETRPWKKRENTGELYNVESWGQQSEKSGCSIYSM